MLYVDGGRVYFHKEYSVKQNQQIKHIIWNQKAYFKALACFPFTRIYAANMNLILKL